MTMAEAVSVQLIAARVPVYHCRVGSPNAPGFTPRAVTRLRARKTTPPGPRVDTGKTSQCVRCSPDGGREPGALLPPYGWRGECAR